MTEKEFWTRYFKSRYFHRNKMRDKADILSYGDDVLFRECRDVDDPQELTPNYAKLSAVSAVLNLTVEEEVRHGYGAARVRDEISMKARPLIQRFNRHAELVLENPVATALDSSTPRKALPGQEQRRPAESATELEDLRKQERLPVIPLNIPSQRVYFELAEHEEAAPRHDGAPAPASLLEWEPGCSLPQVPRPLSIFLSPFATRPSSSLLPLPLPPSLARWRSPPRRRYLATRLLTLARSRWTRSVPQPPYMNAPQRCRGGQIPKQLFTETVRHPKTEMRERREAEWREGKGRRREKHRDRDRDLDRELLTEV